MKTLEQMIEVAKSAINEYDLVSDLHEFTAEFAIEQIAEAIVVERERIVEELEMLRRPFPEKNPVIDSAWDSALNEAIHIIKRSDDER